MKIHHLRNATFIIESKDQFILVDPMLGAKGSLPPFAFIRHKPRRNPLVPLPGNAADLLKKVTRCLVTHCQKWGIEPLTHTDHLDRPGRDFLRKNNIPVICLQRDRHYLEKKGIRTEAGLEYWKPASFPGGQVTAVPARHGHGWNHRLMANGCGFFLRIPDEPGIYICGDTVLTPQVNRALAEFKPDICVVAAGAARMDLGGPILMPLDEVMTLIENAPGKVIANHMDALNHCPVSRAVLAEKLTKKNLAANTYIPADGQTLILDQGRSV